jgi:hypothetical protein
MSSQINYNVILDATRREQANSLLAEVLLISYNNSIGVFWNTRNITLNAEFQEICIDIDLADDFVFCNCELLAANENCQVNSAYPKFTLIERINLFHLILKTILKFSTKVEFRISDQYLEENEWAEEERVVVREEKFVDFILAAYKSCGTTPTERLIIKESDKELLI